MFFFFKLIKVYLLVSELYSITFVLKSPNFGQHFLPLEEIRRFLVFFSKPTSLL